MYNHVLADICTRNPSCNKVLFLSYFNSKQVIRNHRLMLFDSIVLSAHPECNCNRMTIMLSSILLSFESSCSATYKYFTYQCLMYAKRIKRKYIVDDDTTCCTSSGSFLSVDSSLKGILDERVSPGIPDQIHTKYDKVLDCSVRYSICSVRYPIYR